MNVNKVAEAFRKAGIEILKVVPSDDPEQVDHEIEITADVAVQVPVSGSYLAVVAQIGGSFLFYPERKLADVEGLKSDIGYAKTRVALGK